MDDAQVIDGERDPSRAPPARVIRVATDPGVTMPAARNMLDPCEDLSTSEAPERHRPVIGQHRSRCASSIRTRLLRSRSRRLRPASR